MAITIEAYEDWGNTPTRTLITNTNLKSISDPAQNYYLNDVTRPPGTMLGDLQTCSFTRYISFKVSGTYAKVKNIRIELPEGNLADNWRVSYRLTNIYSNPTGGLSELNRNMGNMDGNLIALTSAITVYPRISTIGPASATSRGTVYGSNQTLWTEYLVLQFTCYASNFNDVGNFGLGTIKVLLDELEI